MIRCPLVLERLSLDQDTGAAVIPIDELRHVDASVDPADYDAAVAADADDDSDA